MARVDDRTHAGRQFSRKPFTVVIPNGELAQIRQWVRKYPDTETGGDLFGLWSKGNTAVVQFVLGPGKGSRRTPISYFQDTKYLATAGSILTEQYGLCHIGEWHSHHSLGLAEPSDGDEKTVWSNMPNNGFKRFIIFIANLDKEKIPITQSRPKKYLPVGLGCFLFEVKNTKSYKRYEMMQGSFEVTEGHGPYRQLKELSMAINDGAESINESHEIAHKMVRSRSRKSESHYILLYNESEKLHYDHQYPTVPSRTEKPTTVVPSSTRADMHSKTKQQQQQPTTTQFQQQQHPTQPHSGIGLSQHQTGYQSVNQHRQLPNFPTDRHSYPTNQVHYQHSGEMGRTVPQPGYPNVTQTGQQGSPSKDTNLIHL